jgi:subtilisin family serine protease
VIPAVAVTRSSIGGALWAKGSMAGERLETMTMMTLKHTYTTLYGTSMASADVSTVAALPWSNLEECSSHQIRYVLAVMAYPPSVKQELSHPGCDKKFGYEIVQVKAAFD